MNDKIRRLLAEDWPAVRSIYLEGIGTGLATFETEAPTWEAWDAKHLPFARLVAVDANDKVNGWAALSGISERAVYAGVAEVSVYVAGDNRGMGIGSALLFRLIEESEANGIWTLQASIFTENEASIAIHKNCGFNVVGTRERIAKLKGVWRDTMLLERRSKIIGL